MGRSPQVILKEKTVVTATTNTSDTAVALVGYAKNGEINKPILCTSLKEFKDTFGGIPETAPWSSLAAYRAFNYCNKVYYVRVADESLAQKAKYVIRNAAEAKPAFLTFNQEYSFAAGTFTADKDYGFTLKISEDGTTFTDYRIYLHSPAEGDWEVGDLATQILNAFKPFYNYQDSKSTQLSVSTKGNFFIPIKIGSEGNPDRTYIYRVELFPNSTMEDLVVALNTAFASLSLATTSYEVTKEEETLAGGQYKLYYTLGSAEEASIDVVTTSSSTKKEIAEIINSKLEAIVKAYNDDPETQTQIIGNFTFDYSNGYCTLINETTTTLSLNVTKDVSVEDNIMLLAYSDGIEESMTTTSYTSGNIGTIVDAKIVNSKLRVGNTLMGSDGDYAPIPESKFIGIDTDADKVFGNKVSEAVGSFYDKVDEQFITIDSKATAVPCTTDLSENKVVISTLDGGATLALDAAALTASEQYSNFYDLSIFTDCDYEADMTTKVGGTAEEYYYNHDNIYFVAKDYGTANAGRDGIIVEQVRSTDSTGKEVIKINIYYNEEVVESFNNVSLNPNEKDPEKIYFVTAINNSPDNGGSKYISVSVTRPANPVTEDVEFPEGVYILGEGKLSEADYPDTFDYNPGNDGIPTSNPRKSGISLFTKVLGTDGELANTEVYNYHILATPDNGSQVVQDKASALCEYTGEAFYLVDPPQGLAYNEVVKYENGEGNFGRNTALNSSYQGIFHDWLMDYDEDNENYVWCPPSVFILELLLRNDKQYGCWYAPAGDTRGVLTAADYASSPSLAQRDIMYGDNTVNPIVNFASRGLELYGEKTCLRNETSPMSRIHVRRMAIYIKKLLKNTLRGFIFEGNIASTWTRMTSMIAQILEPIKQQNGIDQYLIQIDSSTMSEADIANSICRGVIKIVPVGSIEVIEMAITYGSFGASIEEL